MLPSYKIIIITLSAAEYVIQVQRSKHLHPRIFRVKKCRDSDVNEYLANERNHETVLAVQTANGLPGTSSGGEETLIEAKAASDHVAGPPRD